MFKLGVGNIRLPRRTILPKSVSKLAAVFLLVALMIAGLPVKPAYAVACTWTGDTSTDWATASNWSGCEGVAPQATDTVVIPDVANDPVLGGDVTIAGLTIQSDGVLSVGANTLTLTGGISNSGTLSGDTGTVVLAFSAYRTLSGSGLYDLNHLIVSASGETVNLSSNVTLHVGGNFSKTAGSFNCNSTANATSNTCTLDFDGGGSSAFSWTTSSSLPWNITVQSGTTVTLGATNSTFTLRGDLGGDGTLTASGGTITFETVTTANLAGTKTLNNVVVNSPTQLLLATNANFGYKGTFTLNGTFDAVTNSPTTLTLAGTSAQTLPSGVTALNNLTINNASGVTLGADVTVNGVLTFTDGKITTGANSLILGSSATISGAGTGKYVYGNLQKPFGTGALDPFTFPVGGSASYTPIILDFGSVSTGGNVTASVSDTVCANFSSSGIDQSNYINRCWSLTNSGMVFDTYDATFTYDPATDFVGTIDENNLAVQKYSGGAWSNPVGDYPYPDLNQVKGAGFASFSTFAVGGATSMTPVTLSYFKAEGSGGMVNFTWSTAAESGNLGFNLYGEENGQLVKLNPELIPSQKVDSLARLDYFYSAATSATVFYLDEIDIRGHADRHGPFALGEEYGGREEESRIDWQAIGEEDQRAQAGRPEVEMTVPAQAEVGEVEPSATPEVESPAKGQEGGEEDGRPSLEISPARPVEAGRLDLSMTSTLNLKVRQSGLYRVTYEQLKAAGLDLKGILVTKVTLTNRGQAVPIYVKGAGRFGPGAYIEFYGQALDTLYTDVNIYTLQIAQSLPPRIPVSNAQPRRVFRPEAGYIETLVVNNQRAYANYAPGADPWYDKEMLVFTAPKTWDYTFQVEGLVASSAATVELSVWGITNWPQGNDHHMQVSVNGIPLADEVFDGLVEKVLVLELPAGLLREGTNTLTITLPGDAGVEAELITLDRFSVAYLRQFQAREGRLAFTSSGRTFTVTNLPTREAVVYRQDNRGIVRLGRVQIVKHGNAYTATFAGTGQPASYFVSAVESLLSPQFEAAQQVVDLNRPAEYLVIAHPNFIPGLEPLVAARRAQGLTVSVVNVNDLYIQYSYGIFDPSAIQKYIAYAAQNLGTKYVLLVGGDTYDYRDNLGIHSISFVPSLYTRTGPIANFVPSDPLFADVNGDNVPDVAIGRFPVRTTAELDMMVNKTLAYAAKTYTKTAVFATDKRDGGISFKAVSDELASAISSDWAVESIHLDDLSVAAARSQLLAAMNRGTALITFTGHSEPREWTFSGLFKLKDAQALTNAGRPFVVVQWGCWNTYYVDPLNNYLVQGFLVSGDRGAAAVLGATTLADSNSEQLLGHLLTPRLTQPGLRLGDALQMSKAELAQTHPDLLDVLLGWSLMGDPALVIQP